MTAALPIVAHLDAITAALKTHQNAVLIAQPGAGKTTCVPPALLAGFATGEIWVLQPRRLAARMAARHVAAALGQKVGEHVGYRVRFDEQVGPHTRVIFMTEALLTRALLSNPTLKHVCCVVFDEFHERALSADLALAALRLLQQSVRRDLHILVMSATLDAGPVAAFLDTPWQLEVEGRQFPVAIEHAPHKSDLPLGAQVLAGVSRLLQEHVSGDILVFLAGMGDMRRVQATIAPWAQRHGMDVVLLHGSQTPEEQDAAVRATPRSKVVLSTNIAQTSITLENVGAVIDSGVARVAQHNVWTGLDALAVRPISQAAATQRSGRAGRLRPGRCLRLYTRQDFSQRASHDTPEMLKRDLTEAALWLKATGLPPLEALPCLDPPTQAAINAAQTLLVALGAVGLDGALTARGKQMSVLPLHPRLARLVCEAENLGVGALGCATAAALAEGRTTLDGDAMAAGNDVITLLRGAARNHALQQVAAHIAQMRRIRWRSWGALLGSLNAKQDTALCRAVLAAFPDRVVARNTGRAGSWLSCQGARVSLTDKSSAHAADYFVAIDAQEGRANGALQTVVQLACPIDSDWLLDLEPSILGETCERAFNPASQRVEEVSQLRYGALVLTESRRAVADAALLVQAAQRAGVAHFIPPDDLAAWRARLGLLAALRPDLPLPGVEDADIAAWVAQMAQGATTLKELQGHDWLAMLQQGIAPEVREALQSWVPSHVHVGQRRLPVHYEAGKPPWVESAMQDFFGLAQGPAIGQGRTPLTLHLLAPNRRAVQVTSDLPGFWERHYPTLKKALSRRYPRHAWPDDPTHAAPPAPRHRRS